MAMRRPGTAMPMRRPTASETTGSNDEIEERRAAVTEGFAERVVEAVGRTGPLCAGVDPSRALLEAWDLSDDTRGLHEFCSRCVESFAGDVPVIKPQVAFFERHGPAGMAVLAELVRDAQAAGLLVVGDGKRGDIDNTSEAYAEAWLGPSSPWAVDAVTVHPYLGLESLAPFVDHARQNNRGVLVVVRSSNPEGGQLQDAVTSSGVTVEDVLLSGIAELNRKETTGIGAVGAVIGATLAPTRFDLRTVRGVLLAPGVGSQGGSAAQVSALFSGCPAGSVLPSTSRAVLAHGPSEAKLRAAAVRVRDELGAALS
jgi:orotidine-5'-phosphate decarboxylase